ncbi:hypothetical protein B4N89_46540 [Embleya scabrispora]|uniref:Uncharacterized protein n=1 Tax=Embleya scabrispora TaxID=159449 RepID=A0A1T3NI76_9ACTN|nr:hypothetical protein [Embleya scabrispora]OPC76492.1 hypothetical protein B4N89_46540 [Embleya scabrispora]
MSTPPRRRSRPGPSLRAAWQLQADALLTQRLHLHLDEWRTAVGTTPSAATAHPRDRDDAAGRPSAPTRKEPTEVANAIVDRAVDPPREAARLLDRAGLAHWWRPPRLHGHPAGPPHTSSTANAAHTARTLLGEPRGVSWHHAAIEAAVAGAWWVGFFAAIRPGGTHHRDPDADLPALDDDTLTTAAQVVAAGVCARVLRTRLRIADTPPVRRAYCRAVIAGLDAERTLPALLDALAETRLVDLVGTSLAWHGQFAAYAQGSASGRRE